MRALLLIVVLVWAPGIAWAQSFRDMSWHFTLDSPVQEDVQGTAPAAADDAAPATGEMVSILTLQGYEGGLDSTRYLLGDWGGLRSDLARRGIVFEFDLVQTVQGNAHGGHSTSRAIAYSGSVDYTVMLDTARLGLWPAGLLLIKGETQFGRTINGQAGSIMAVNADGLFPVPEDPGATTLTDVVYTQFLSETFGFALGKIDFRAGDQNVFAHSENTQFMNLALVANPALLNMVPYSALTAGLFYRPADWLTVSFTMLDGFGRADTAGFDTAFHSPQGTTFVTEWDFTLMPFGLPGHQRFGLAYSNKTFLLLTQNERINLPILGLLRAVLNPNTSDGEWAFYYNFDQYIYVEEDDPTQGVGVFGRLGFSDGEVNPVTAFYSVGIGGKGIVPTRDHDTFGVGYYYVDVSDDIPDLLNIGSEQGVEIFYNIEVTPWLHITPDLQIIMNPGGGDEDVAVVYGIRAHMSL